MSTSHQHDNPFFNRQRITDAAYFSGRDQEIEALYSAIATHQCRSIVGERKLGKSSLLTHLCNPATLREHGFDPQQFAFLYVDLEGMARITYDELWPEWLDLLAAALPDSAADLKDMALELAQSDIVRFLQVRRLMRRIERAGLTVVIMLDEFESLAANPAFEPGFYGELRSLAGELGVVYLTASKRSLFDLTYRHADTLSSPFFNIFSEVTLGLMSETDAEHLLRTVSEQHNGRAFNADEITFLRELAGPHPFFLQVGGFHMHVARNEALERGVAREQVARRMKMEAEDHFRYWWQQLSTAERSAVKQLNHVQPEADVLRRLQESALVRRFADGRWQPFSQAFAEFLDRVDARDRNNLLSIGSSDTEHLSGVTLGSYRVLTPIGRGGMAVVYRGYQPALDRYVAIKVMSSAVSVDRAFAERFQREAATVARLRHQNLVHMLDFGVQGDISYMVMEYIEGQTLRERLNMQHQKSEFIPLEEVARIVQDTAAALDYAHAHGIVHRDVKPTNIMLRPEERLAQLTGAVPFTAVLTDFGVARMLEGMQLTGTGATIGTPDYMSPEQAKGEPATGASDIYALGVVLFELLTNELPFTADYPLAVLLKHLQSRPPLLASKVPELPASLDFVIMRALDKDPRARFGTAGQLAEAVTSAVEANL